MGKLFQELQALKAEYDRKLEQEGEAALKDAFKDIFEKYPEVRSIVWTQYTPYFNDGDTCYFRVNDWDANIGTKESLQSEIDEKKRLTVEAANASDYKRAQALKEEVEALQERLDDGDSDDDYQWGEGLYGLEDGTDREKEIYKAINELERELPEDLLESIFGDHVKVVANRNGFDVTEYDHD